MRYDEGMVSDALHVQPRPVTSFDVICAGEATLKVGEDIAHVRLGGGAVRAALSLSRDGLHVGLATVLADDSSGREIVKKLAASGIDVEGARLAPPVSGLFFVTGGAKQIVTVREEEEPVSIPEGWQSQVLLLAGMSPIVSHGAALCRAARAARRIGSTVVVDLHARWDLWKGRDARSIRMVLREADVVWCSGADLLGLNMDIPSIRSAMRPGAVFAMHSVGQMLALGSFGEIVRPSTLGPTDEDDDFASAICSELARAGHSGDRDGGVWERILARGLAASLARQQRR